MCGARLWTGPETRHKWRQDHQRECRADRSTVSDRRQARIADLPDDSLDARLFRRRLFPALLVGQGPQLHVQVLEAIDAHRIDGLEIGCRESYVGVDRRGMAVHHVFHRIPPVGLVNDAAVAGHDAAALVQARLGGAVRGRLPAARQQGLGAAVEQCGQQG